MQFTRPTLVKFSVIDRTGTEIERARKVCARPFATKIYKQLLNELSTGKIKAVQTGPVNTF